MNTVHRAVLTLGRGRWGTTFLGMDTITLTTIGRRSGRPHDVILTVPVVESGALVIVASRGGGDISPAWLHNLRANPSVTVTSGGRSRPMIARELPPVERDRVWPRVVAVQSGYGDYQRKTTRIIPLVALTPA